MAKRVVATYFSATGTTEVTVMNIANKLAKELNLDLVKKDFTLPKNREVPLDFSEDDIVVFGVPVYAGRVPNVLLKYLKEMDAKNTIGIAITTFGNRNYDDALLELKNIMDNKGIRVIGAGAFSCEHSFSLILGANRPDDKDREEQNEFAKMVSKKIKNNDFTDIHYVKREIRPYYTPRDRNGNPVDIRKVKPITTDACNNCKLCVKACPMGSIDFDDVSKLNGICIKCCACVKICPMGAKKFIDKKFIYHKEELEAQYKRRAQNKIFL